MEDIAGKVHWFLALLLIGLVALHTLAALKHHFIDRDWTLKKMLGIPMRVQTNLHQPKENIQ
jgi:cytochrome b561